MGKLNFNLEDYQKAAITAERQLLKIPMLAMGDTLKYMTPRTGIRGTQLVGQESVNAELAPYKANRKTSLDLDIVLRPLTTYFGSVNAEFDPNESISTLMGHAAANAMGEGLKSTPTAREVLALVPKAIGERLTESVWNGKRNANGSTTKDLCDGFDTIAEKEIAAGELSADKGNLLVLDEKITAENADAIFERVLESMSPKLRGQKAYIFCSQDIADMYNKAYKKHSGGLVYNSQYEQQYVEGSNKRLEIVPLAGKEGSKYMQVSVQSNMLVGFDQESDEERVAVNKYAPDTLTYEMRAFFGTQYRSLDKSQLMVVQLAAE